MPLDTCSVARPHVLVVRRCCCDLAHVSQVELDGMLPWQWSIAGEMLDCCRSCICCFKVAGMLVPCAATGLGFWPVLHVQLIWHQQLVCTDSGAGVVTRQHIYGVLCSTRTMYLVVVSSCFADDACKLSRQASLHFWHVVCGLMRAWQYAEVFGVGPRALECNGC